MARKRYIEHPKLRVAAAVLLIVFNVGLIGWLVQRHYAAGATASAASMGGASAGEMRAPVTGGNLDLSNLTIPEDEIHSGGPPKDGIPAILDPKFVGVGDVDYLEDKAMIIGFEEEGDARAYPLAILVFHEIVNDVVGERPVAITYCPLCGTSMVFDREVDGETLSFGVSGLLYNSDVLMYDHQTDGLWSQLKMEAVSGPHAGKELEWAPSDVMTWKAWRDENPMGKVLSKDTGFSRPYGNDPYGGYEDSPGTMFPVPQHRDDLPLKAWVAGVRIDGAAKAYAEEELADLDDGRLLDVVGGREIVVEYEAESRRVIVRDAQTKERLPHVMVYWFAWQGFYPETELYEG